MTVSSDSADGREQRAERALQRPGGHQHAERLRQPPIAEATEKPIRPADERPLATEQIAELAAQQQQAAERQRVGGDDPLPVARSRSPGPACAEGSAMFTIVASSTTISCATPRRARTAQRFGSGCE